MSDFSASAFRFCESVGDMSQPQDIVLAADAVSQECGLRLFAVWIVPQHPEDFAAWKLDETVFYNTRYEHLASPAQRENWQTTSSALTRRYGSPLTVYGRTRDFPFTLSEAMRELRLNGAHDWAFALLRRYGVRDGVYCPSRNWQCFFAAPKVLTTPDCGPLTRAVLHVVSGAACDRIGQLAKRPVDRKTALSARELEVLRLSSHGKTNRSIAEELHISPETVKTHTKRIMRKLEAKNFAHALLKAARQRMID